MYINIYTLTSCTNEVFQTNHYCQTFNTVQRHAYGSYYDCNHAKHIKKI